MFSTHIDIYDVSDEDGEDADDKLVDDRFSGCIDWLLVSTW